MTLSIQPMYYPYTHPWWQVPSTEPAPQPAHYHYHYHYPPTSTDKITSAIEVGDWVYSKSETAPIIGEVVKVLEATRPYYLVNGMCEGSYHDKWHLWADYAIKIERP